MSDTAYRKTVLANGVTVVTERIPMFRSATIGFWVNAGSRQETPENNGVSHFLEHLLFKGTETRSARDIAEVMDAVGGHLNAATEREQTVFYSQVVDTCIDLALDVLTDMYLHSLIDPEELAREKNVIFDEIRKYEDAPDDQIWDLFMSTLWAGHPLGQPILGRSATVRSISRQIVVDFMREEYLPSHLLVSAAGNVDHDRVVQFLDRTLGQVPASPVRRLQHRPVFHRQHLIQPRDCEQVYIAMGTEGISAKDERKYALALVDAALGGGLSCRLFQEIREQRGLAYTVSSFQNTYSDSGLFGAYAETSAANAQEVIDLMTGILATTRDEGITAAELTRARESMRNGMVLAQESTYNRMSRLARSELTFGRLISIEEIERKMDAVTLDEANDLARTFLDPDQYAFVILGPVSDRITLPASAPALAAKLRGR